MQPSGCATSSKPATSRLASWMNGASRMSTQATCAASRSATSSPASESGALPFGVPAGTTTDLFGLVPVRANLSASQAKKLGLLTSGTFGQPGSTSSKSAALQSSLESKLRQRLNGSSSCEVIWKPRPTLWAIALSRPRALARTISGTAIGLWATATTPSGGQTVPPGTTMSGRRPDGTKAQVTLQNMVIALWSTIRASDGAKGGPNQSFGAGGSPLPSQVWAVASTSNAPTESGAGSLHPEFAGWVMGFPPEWLSCTPLETPSIPAQRKRSSKA